MIRKPLLVKIFEAADMKRWNDKICPVELRELDKQAHKMIIAYVLGRFEKETSRRDFNWIELIEGGIFEFLQRLVVTDLKPQLFHKIKEDHQQYKQLNNWVYKQIEPFISPLGDEFCRKYQDYHLNPDKNINKRILSAAHFYATKWEFEIIERANPKGYEIAEIKRDLQAKQEKYYDLKALQQLTLYSKLKNFIDLCGELRFQVRWSHIHRVHRTSVLGHMLIVAILGYLFSLEIKACKRRSVNNYFTGLFHDLPEVLTRDIIDPVKKSIKGLSRLIKEYEKKEMNERIYKLIPKAWHAEMKMFTGSEFKGIVDIDYKLEEKSSEEISKNYNKDRFNPRDGEVVKAADDLGAFIETYLEKNTGTFCDALKRAHESLKEKYKNVSISGFKIGDIYADFE